MFTSAFVLVLLMTGRKEMGKTAIPLRAVDHKNMDLTQICTFRWNDRSQGGIFGVKKHVLGTIAKWKGCVQQTKDNGSSTWAQPGKAHVVQPVGPCRSGEGETSPVLLFWHICHLAGPLFSAPSWAYKILYDKHNFHSSSRLCVFPSAPI